MDLSTEHNSNVSNKRNGLPETCKEDAEGCSAAKRFCKELPQHETHEDPKEHHLIGDKSEALKTNLLPVTRSPKKRLDVPKPSCQNKEKNIYRYGNYAQYYGYRNSKNSHDVRLDLFKNYKDLFEGKDVLDVGCNCGRVTIHVGKHMNVKSIIGIDIDKSLITRARNYIRRQRQLGPKDDKTIFPFNTSFVHGNYVLRHEVLLEMETSRFDLILCLSVTKWIQLNFGDAGLKLIFKRMYLQLRQGGRLVLEPQPWESYARRKKLTPEIFENYKAIKLRPNNFIDYLLSSEVGFDEFFQMETPNHESKGFKRPIYVFVKK